MAWSAPYTATTGDLITASIWNTYIKNQQRYLKGIDGVVTIESGIILDNTGGDEYLLLPLLTTAEAGTVLDAEGKVAFDEQTHRIKFYNGTELQSLQDIAKLFIASGARGDILYRGATAWSRLAKGTANFYLKQGANDPAWASAISARLKLGSFTNDAVNGTQAIAGVGFQPAFIIFYQIAAVLYWGLDDGTIHTHFYDGGIMSGTHSLRPRTDGGNQIFGRVTTLGADGFTITWENLAGTAPAQTVYYAAFKEG